MGQNTSVINLVGNVVNPNSINQQVGNQPLFSAGRQGEVLTSEVHGKWYQYAANGALFTANVTAVTIPVIANGLVSVFSLYNPVGSGIIMELVDFDLGSVLATTVVDTVGLYFDAGTRAAAATFTTKGTIQSGLIGSGLVGKGQFYSALTHVNSAGTARYRILGSFGATTDAVSSFPHVDFDGKAIIPEGVIVSVAMSTAAGTASGLDVGMSWIEAPKPA